MLQIETICPLYGPNGLEQFLGPEVCNLVNDAFFNTAEGTSFALGTHVPVAVGDLDRLLRGLRRKQRKAIGDDRTIAALRLVTNEMISRGVTLVH